jgi:two-component system, chemotaxis family, sensor kinase CheA
LTTFAERALALGRSYLPKRAEGDPEAERRLLTTLLFTAVFVTQAPLFSGFYWLIGVPLGSATVVLAATVAVLSVPFLARRSVRMSSNALIAVLWCAFVVLAFLTDGHRSAPLFWLAALPVVATLTTTGRDPVLWLAAAALVPAGLWAWELSGGTFRVVTAGVPRDALHVLCVAMLSCVLFGLALAYESARRAQMRAVEAMNRNMRLVLDNVEQGFITVGPDGSMVGQRSAITETWLGKPDGAASFADWVAASDRRAGDLLAAGLEQVFDDFLPVEVAIDQLPHHCQAGGRTLDLHYRPIVGQGAPSSVVVIVSDATERIQAEQAEAAQRELTALVSHWARDRQGVQHFLAEAEHIVTQLSGPSPSALRLVHTLKGNTALFGMRGVASVCHDVETAAQESQRPPSGTELARVRGAWAESSARITPLFNTLSTDEVTIPRRDLASIVGALDSDAPRESVRQMVVELEHEPAERIFARFAEQAASLARRLGKSDIIPAYESNGVRFDPARWNPVWSAMVHAVRNAVDHGGEPADERIARGKPAELSLTFTCRNEADGLHVVMADDGAGVDWERVRQKAAARGLPHETLADLENALFTDGLSTREEASDVSGRGVGLGALREACHSLGGEAHLRSERGRGTTLSLYVPRAPAHDAQHAA